MTETRRKTEYGDTLDLYIGSIPEIPAYRPLLPAERQALIEATRSEAVKVQRFYAWNALLTGLLHSCGLDAEDAGLSRTESGKWVSTAAGISISHCKTAVAAAVSAGSVGVDIEPLEDPRYKETLLNRIATEKERNLFPELSTGQRVATIWTRKEAAFKRDEHGLHTPLEADAASDHIRTIVIRLGDRAYAVSVAAERDTELRVFEVNGEQPAKRTDYERLSAGKSARPYCVYMLRCSGDRLYTGVTTDPDRRFSEHGGSSRGAKFTRAFRPESVAALWQTDSGSLAQKLEARIKKLNRKQKDLLIERNDWTAIGESVDASAYRRIEV